MNGLAERTLPGYARLYAALAVLTIVLSCQPLFARTVEVGGVEVADPLLSLWAELVSSAHGATMLGVLLFIALIVLLTVGAFGARSIGVAAGIAIAAVLMSVLVLLRPGYADPLPDLTSWGQATAALGVVTAMLGVAHAVHLGAYRNADRPRE